MAACNQSEKTFKEGAGQLECITDVFLESIPADS